MGGRTVGHLSYCSQITAHTASPRCGHGGTDFHRAVHNTVQMCSPPSASPSYKTRRHLLPALPSRSPSLFPAKATASQPQPSRRILHRSSVKHVHPAPRHPPHPGGSVPRHGRRPLLNNRRGAPHAIRHRAASRPASEQSGPQRPAGGRRGATRRWGARV